MFAAKGKLCTSLKLWWNPPPVAYHQSTPPHPDTYHCRRLLLWAPRMMWKVNFHCPHCGVKESLRSKGLYNHVRLVMDMKEYYYVAAEYMDCRACSGTFISWDHRMLDQLADGVCACFPILMTRKYACDGDLGGASESRCLHPRPSWCAALHHDRQHEEGPCDAANFEVCMWLHLPGELPPPPGQIRAWKLCWCRQLSGIHPGRHLQVELCSCCSSSTIPHSGDLQNFQLAAAEPSEPAEPVSPRRSGILLLPATIILHW